MRGINPSASVARAHFSDVNASRDGEREGEEVKKKRVCGGIIIIIITGGGKNNGGGDVFGGRKVYAFLLSLALPNRDSLSTHTHAHTRTTRSQCLLCVYGTTVASYECARVRVISFFFFFSSAQQTTSLESSCADEHRNSRPHRTRPTRPTDITLSVGYVFLGICRLVFRTSVATTRDDGVVSSLPFGLFPNLIFHVSTNPQSVGNGLNAFSLESWTGVGEEQFGDLNRKKNV